ncbi:unnamed protein product [Phytomonas sp. EM1]|nr:unnamed protein product [Phytomonas sp. EM1]|eukprot:CCW61080.1 unnamed protein product [Phytomonas sp. isolate EM1]
MKVKVNKASRLGRKDLIGIYEYRYRSFQSSYSCCSLPFHF